ncbi:MAG: glutaredoxin family protein [Gammaproteobacteria bacterium]|nr:glutaredoxin family protein [Gammaproteobacteria bacterium]
MTTPMTQQIVLYGTEGCHLCDEARDILDMELAGNNRNIDYPYIDIVENDELLERYGQSIPVIQFIKSGHELFWPFDINDVRSFLRKEIEDG